MFNRKIILFLIGFLIIFQINLIGLLTYSEVITIVLFGFVGARAVIFAFSDKNVRIILLFLGLYLASQITTDLIRDTQFSDMLRGWSKIAILGLNLIILAYYSRLKIQNLVWYFWGLSSGLLFQTLFIGTSVSHLWKFGMGPAVTSLSSLAVGAGLLPFPGFGLSIAFLGIGVFHLLMNARSLAGFTIITGIITLLPKPYLRGINPKKIINLQLAIPLVGAMAVVYFLYSVGAPAGWWGEEAKAKYEMQYSSGKNIILGGRGESVASLVAIGDSPIIGHGSWAKGEKYVLIYLLSTDVDPDSEVFKDAMALGLIPSHSHLLGAWVEAGILGMLFWLVALRFAISGIMCAVRLTNTPFRMFIIFTMFVFVWDLPFSPFGLDRRLSNAAILVLCVSLIRFYESHTAKRKADSVVRQEAVEMQVPQSR